MDSGNKQSSASGSQQSQKDIYFKQNQASWLKYKTSLCRHWEQTKTCSLGSMCTFAHGHAELRKINDPMPEDFPGRNNVGALFSNYKTQICRNYQQTGECKFESYCCYAHGSDQLRGLTDPMPPVLPQVMLYNPSNAKMMGTSSNHVRAAHSQFLHGNGQPEFLQEDNYTSDSEPYGETQSQAQLDLNQNTPPF